MKSKPSWFKPRNYLHFDFPIKAKHADDVATNPLKVRTHSFYPFISYVNTTYKLKKDKQTNKLKLEPKPRDISYASHMDSAIYAYYSKTLSEFYEKALHAKDLGGTVIAFRPLNKQCNIDFAKTVFNEIQTRENCSAIGLDISGFFDNLNHNYLKERWAALINQEKLPDDHYRVFKSVTKFASVQRDQLYSLLQIPKNNPKAQRHRICSAETFRSIVRQGNLISKNNDIKGIPQGSPISATLSNIYMLDFDTSLSSFVKDIGGVYYRYCDDMVMVVPTEKRDLVINFASNEIKKLQLDINQKKTEISNFMIVAGQQKSDRPFQYLGFTFDGEKILLRSASLDRYSAKMKGGVRLAKLTKDKRNRIRVKNGLEEKGLYKHKIYKLYSHLGHRNFLSYGYRAANKMDSKHIRKQLKPLWGRLVNEINKC